MSVVLFLYIFNDRISVGIIGYEVKLNTSFPGILDHFFTFDGIKLI
jgi:hypothetical protein